MTKLKPCPFCGGEAKITDGGFSGEQFLVRCRESLCPAASGTVRKTQKQAIAAWNCRTQPENKPLKLEEIRGMYSEPLYVKSLLDGQIFGALIHNQNAAAYVMCGVRYDTFKNYGKTWLAYRAMPVVRGEWVAFDPLNMERPYNWVCSSCGYGCVDYRTTYCHDCGAKMEVEHDQT